MPLQEKGPVKEAEILVNEVLETRNRILGLEHPKHGKIQRGRETGEPSSGCMEHTIHATAH